MAIESAAADAVREVALATASTFDEYMALVETLVAAGRTTGPVQSEALAQYTGLGLHRVRRLLGSLVLEPGARDAARAFDLQAVWLVITEAWCPDSAHALPVIERLAAEAPAVRTRYVLRDEHAALMDRFLTDGARSIPKLLCVDEKTRLVRWTWGPRPAPAMALFRKLKAQGVDKRQTGEQVQRWLLADDGRTMQAELRQLMAGARGDERSAR
jgi:hypothetical protein